MMYTTSLTEKTMSECIANLIKRRQHPDSLCQATFIVDMEGFSMAQATYKPGSHTNCSSVTDIDIPSRMSISTSLMSVRKCKFS